MKGKEMSEGADAEQTGFTYSPPVATSSPSFLLHRRCVALLDSVHSAARSHFSLLCVFAADVIVLRCRESRNQTLGDAVWTGPRYDLLYARKQKLFATLDK